jgi:hypothetical protein
MAGQARAEPRPAGTFDYRAPPECPSRAEFSAQVAARTGSWQAPDSPFSVTVRIDEEQAGVVGRVTFDRAGQRTLRELRAAGCTELTQALSLIVAVFVDPHVTSRAPAPGEPPPPPVYLVSAAAPPPQRPGLWFAVGPEAALTTAITRDPTFGERVFLQLGRGNRSLLASSARLSFSHLAGHELSPASGNRAEFELDAARLDGCLLRVAEAALAFEPCLVVEVGRLRAVGVHHVGRVTHDQAWGALGMVLRPTLTLARRLVLGAGLGFSVPLQRYRFAFTGESELTHNPDLAFEASLSLALRFP